MRAGLIFGALLTWGIGAFVVLMGYYHPHIPGVVIKGSTTGLYIGGGVCFVVGLGLLAFSLVAGRVLGVESKLLATGVPATAVIKAVRDTGISLQNGMYTVLEFTLQIGPATPSPYQVTCRSTVPRVALSQVGLGKLVAVKVDPANPNLVAIDWNAVTA